MNLNDQFDIETETLQADVMRFLAIIAFSLLVIFIPLIQTISREPQPETNPDIVESVEIKQEQHKPEDEPKKEQQKTTEKPEDENIIVGRAVIAKSNKTVPDKKEKTKMPKKNGDQQKSRQLVFGKGIFQALLSSRLIKGYVILPDNDLAFEFKHIKGNFLFSKNSPQNIRAVLKLRKSTLPNTLIPSFEKFYPSLAMQKKEFYFVPSAKIRAELNKIQKSSQFGRFKIMENGKIIHEQ